MSKKNIRKCIVCGSEYEYCPSCNKYSNMPRWKFNFDLENCKNIFMIASAYNSKTITSDEARAQFEACDLSNKDSFSASVINVIKEVFPNSNVEEKQKSPEVIRENNSDAKIERPKKDYNKHYQREHDRFRKQ